MSARLERLEVFGHTNYISERGGARPTIDRRVTVGSSIRNRHRDASFARENQANRQNCESGVSSPRHA
jgi:hypothetical protein